MGHAVGHRPKTGFNLTYSFGADFELPAHLRIREILRATIKYLALPLREGCRAKQAQDFRFVGLFGSRGDRASLAHLCGLSRQELDVRYHNNGRTTAHPESVLSVRGGSECLKSSKTKMCVALGSLWGERPEPAVYQQGFPSECAARQRGRD